MNNYSTRELEIVLKGVTDKMDENHNVVIEKINKLDKNDQEISNHVQKTNGRVKKLEIWKAGIIGALSVITVTSAIMGFILRDQLEFFLNPEEKIKEAVEQVINNTEIEVELNED
jgi:hypothetical protein